MKIRLAPAKMHFSLAVLILLLGTFTAFAQWEQPFSINNSPLPAPTSPVNDYAGVMDAATKAALEKRVIDYKKTSGVELAVAIVKTTGDRPIFDYSLAVARGWKIGSKEEDNPSALLFVAIDDRKYFTQVSKNLEDELPDGIAGNIQRQYLVPEFRKQNYAKGIADTIEGFITRIESVRSGTAPAPSSTPARGGTERVSSGLFTVFCCLAVLLVVILIIWSNRGGGGKSKRDNDRWGGGFGGGASALPWIIGSAIGSSGSSSSSSDWGGSSGGSDWGGFGGGGDFGGGGAGGDW